MSLIEDGFNTWWRGAPVKFFPKDNHLEAFKAGAEWAEAQEKANRKGSDLRGRVITQHRVLMGPELERERMDPDTNWPCLELDDGTLVYCKVPDPFVGYVPTRSKGKRKVTFNVDSMRVKLGDDLDGEG